MLAARGDELERGFPYGVVRQLFEQVLPQGEQQERRDLLRGAAALAAPALGVDAGDLAAAPDTRADDDLAFRVTHGLYWLAANLAERGSLAIFVDAMHRYLWPERYGVTHNGEPLGPDDTDYVYEWTGDTLPSLAEMIDDHAGSSARHRRPQHDTKQPERRDTMPRQTQLMPQADLVEIIDREVTIAGEKLSGDVTDPALERRVDAASVALGLLTDLVLRDALGVQPHWNPTHDRRLTAANIAAAGEVVLPDRGDILVMVLADRETWGEVDGCEIIRLTAEQHAELCEGAEPNDLDPAGATVATFATAS